MKTWLLSLLVCVCTTAGVYDYIAPDQLQVQFATDGGVYTLPSRNTDATKVELREYIERILTEREKALNLTATALETRLTHLNALRDDVIRDRAMFVNKDVFATLVLRVEAIEKWQARVIGIGTVLVLVASIVGGVLVRLVLK